MQREQDKGGVPYGHGEDSWGSSRICQTLPLYQKYQKIRFDPSIDKVRLPTFGRKEKENI